MMANPSLTQTLIDRSKSFREPYEFLFKINDNIIVQRFFTVGNYNPESIYSLELKEAIDECTFNNIEHPGIIQDELKNRTLDFMDEFRYYFADDSNFDRNDSLDKYLFQVRVNGKIVIEKSWDATIYPAKIRYDVNIKRHIARIINIIQNVLSMPSKRLTTKFQHYSLTPPVDATEQKD
jgi:hypothetical protein